jgi:hypothetical protein
MVTNEPDRCIRLEIPGEGHFDITKDTAELWLHQITIQLENLGSDDKLDDESGEMPLDSENPTPLVGMD